MSLPPQSKDNTTTKVLGIVLLQLHPLPSFPQIFRFFFFVFRSHPVVVWDYILDLFSCLRDDIRYLGLKSSWLYNSLLSISIELSFQDYYDENILKYITFKNDLFLSSWFLGDSYKLYIFFLVSAVVDKIVCLTFYLWKDTRWRQ